MANFLVISTSDDGAGSLRQALADAAENEGADTIEFAPWMSGQEIQLQTTLTIESGNDVTINGDLDGDGDPDITISGDSQNDGHDAEDVDILLDIEAGATVTVNSVHFTSAYARGENGFFNSYSDYGGGQSAYAGLRNEGTLALTDSILSEMTARGGDGYGRQLYQTGAAGDATAGIVNSGQLTVSDSHLEAVFATGGAAGYYSFNGLDGGNAVAGILNAGDVTLAGLIGTNSAAYGGNGGATLSVAYGPTGGDGGDGIVGLANYGTIIAASGGARYNFAAGGDGGAGYVDGDPGSGYAAGYAAEHLFDVLPTSGDDVVTVGDAEAFYGGAGDDIIDNSDGSGILRGGSGHDQIETGGGAARAYGGSGNDIIINTLIGSNTIMDGGAGVDLLDQSQDVYVSIQLNMTTGAGSLDFGGTLYGFTARNFENVIGINDAGFSDTITGTSGANIISGLAGNDVLRGMNGDDALFGGDGDDTLRGGNHNDILRGDADEDMLFGDNGNDLLFGGTGNDTLRGGKGNDRLFGQGDNDTLFGDKGKDRLFGGDGDDTLRGGKSNDRLKGGDGEDIFAFAKREGKKNVIVDFEDGADKFDLSGFNFKNKKQALKKFSEVGGANNDVSQFAHQGTKFKIKGADLSDLNKADILL